MSNGNDGHSGSRRMRARRKWLFQAPGQGAPVRSCKEIRFQVGADPRHLGWRAKFHLLICRACGRYLRETQELDKRIEAALRIDLESPAARTDGPAPSPVQP
jgi:hypothetical protein